MTNDAKEDNMSMLNDKAGDFDFIAIGFDSDSSKL